MNAWLSFAPALGLALVACSSEAGDDPNDESELVSLAAGRFDPGAESRTAGAFNPVNAAWLGRTAKIVYDSRERQVDAAEQLKVAIKTLGGDDLVVDQYRYFDAEGDTQAAYIATNRVAILVFRGTESKADIWTDLDFRKENGIHHGVYQAWESVWTGAKLLTADKQGMRDFLREEHAKREKVPFYITGHSLGGAIATVALKAALEENVPVTALYTFGSPRVGNDDFANDVATRARERGTFIYRVVNQGDAVTVVPKLGFKHIALDSEDEQEGNARFVFLSKQFGKYYVGTANGEHSFFARVGAYIADLMAHDMLHHPMAFYLCKLDRLSNPNATCPDVVERQANRACTEMADLVADVVARNHCGDSDQAAAAFKQAAGCTTVVRVRDEVALRSICMPSLEKLSCDDLAQGRIDESCRMQFLQE